MKMSTNAVYEDSFFLHVTMSMFFSIIVFFFRLPTISYLQLLRLQSKARSNGYRSTAIIATPTTRCAIRVSWLCSTSSLCGVHDVECLHEYIFMGGGG